jgi:membrane protein YdbS with pleckstrin-like domain
MKTMLEKIYEKSSKKKLKSILSIYYALLINSIVLPILFLIIGYFLNGKIYFKNLLIVFVVIFIWSLFNVEYLKKKIKTE